jgi:phospholipid N-methyltransferase
VPHDGQPEDVSLLGCIWERCLFFLQFLRHPLQLGAASPCSRRIAEKIGEELEDRGASRVVELGAGTGSLTRGILRAIGSEEPLLCVEREASFCRHLRRRFGERVRVVQDDAYRVEQIIDATAWERPDAIVCSVPLIRRSSAELCASIARSLPAEALYLQVANFRKPVEESFDIEKSYLFLANLPPEHLHCAVPRNGQSA